MIIGLELTAEGSGIRLICASEGNERLIFECKVVGRKNRSAGSYFLIGDESK